MKGIINHKELLRQRLKAFPSSRLQARTILRHFALVNYCVSPEKLEAIIPADLFEVSCFPTSNGVKAFISAVAFVDVDFNFPRLASGLKFSFPQTNHRAYVTDRRTGQPVVWFFGTNLGSRLVHVPRLLWKIPWHVTKYEVDCRHDSASGHFTKYHYHFESKWCRGRLKLRDSGESISVMAGFQSMEEMKLILTHPVRGYYRRLDGQIGSYQVWHKEMDFTKGIAEEAYFSLYEKMGLLTQDEMRQPYSIFLCPEVEFDIQLPPQIIR